MPSTQCQVASIAQNAAAIVAKLDDLDAKVEAGGDYEALERDSAACVADLRQIEKVATLVTAQSPRGALYQIVLAASTVATLEESAPLPPAAYYTELAAIRRLLVSALAALEPVIGDAASVGGSHYLPSA
jgi:hypothetical protein